jgi:hypothetical protein
VVLPVVQAPGVVPGAPAVRPGAVEVGPGTVGATAPSVTTGPVRLGPVTVQGARAAAPDAELTASDAPVVRLSGAEADLPALDVAGTELDAPDLDVPDLDVPDVELRLPVPGTGPGLPPGPG